MKISQAQRILAALHDRRGEWVPMPDLWTCREEAEPYANFHA